MVRFKIPKFAQDPAQGSLVGYNSNQRCDRGFFVIFLGRNFHPAQPIRPILANFSFYLDLVAGRLTALTYPLQNVPI